MFNGNNGFDVLVPSWSTIPYAVEGFSFTASADPTSTTGMAGVFGIRKDGHLIVTPETRVDASGREQTDGYLTKLEIDSWQTDYASFKNCYLLSKQYVAVAPQVNFQDWYNFTTNSANPPFATPNGSCSLGMEIEYTVAQKDVTNKLTFTGKMHPKEWDWTLSHATARYDTATASTAVATVSLSSMVYSMGAYGIPGINTVTVSGDNIGLISEDTKVTIKTVAPSKDVRERPLVKFFDVEISGKALQGRYYDAQGMANDRNADFSVTANLWTGMNLVFNNSLSFVGAPDFSDSTATIPFKLKGRIAYDPNGTFRNITFTDATSTITFSRSVYQP